MEIIRCIKDWHQPWKTGSEPSRSTLLEVLEPRILLSVDGLLNVIISDQGQDTLLDGRQQVVQYAELLDTNEQVEEQISQELTPSDTPNTDVYQPIFTLFVDDDNTNDESIDADLTVDNICCAQFSHDIALLSDGSDGDIESKVDTTEDDSPPVYINDAEISIKKNTSIEIRGPPVAEGCGLSNIACTSYIDVARSDELLGRKDALNVQLCRTADLLGLYLVDPTVDYFDGQIIYFDFDGAEDVTYNGPVTVEGIDVPVFIAPGELAGQEKAIIADVVIRLEEVFAGSGVVFTTEKPAPGQIYSTIFVGGDDSAFAEYGSFRGLAEQVDVGNWDPHDNAFVFSENIFAANENLISALEVLVQTIAHETLHLLGAAHESHYDLKESDHKGSLLEVAPTLLCLTLVADVSAATTYYVDVDSIGGPSSDNNPGTIDQPFRTIEKARDTIRETGADGITVYIRGGTYYLSQPLEFDGRDSGAPGAPNIYRGYPGETPAIKGSVKIPYTDFTTHSGSIIKADLSSYGLTDVQQVFLNDKRLILARFPNYDANNSIGGGFLMFASDSPGSTTQFRWTAGDVDPSSWTNISRIQANTFTYYCNQFSYLSAIDVSDRLVTLKTATRWVMVNTYRYYFQNIFEELDAENEWYWDADSKILYLWPPHELTAADTISIPIAQNCLSLSGADFIRFEGLTIAECNDIGVYINDCDTAEIKNCTITNTKSIGIRMYNAVNSKIDGCNIYETGGRAINIESSKETFFKPLINAGNVITNCTIHDTGYYDSDGVNGAIYCWSLGNTISWNHIYNTPRIGIFIWGNDNIVEYNHVHDNNQKSFDSGGIYIYGASWVKRGNIVRYNYIHDTGGYQFVNGAWHSYPYNTFGIYLDDWASGNQVLYNTVKKTFYGNIFVHGGRDNRIEHNVFVAADNGPCIWFREWVVTNAGYDMMWTELQDVLNSRNGWDGAKYLARYPEIVDIPAPDPPSEEYYFTGNICRYNTLVWPSAPAREAYRVYDLNLATTTWDGNILWPGSRTLEVRYNGNYIGFTAWQGYGFDLLSKNIETDLDPEDFVLLVNTEKEEKSFSLGGQKYYDVSGDRVPDSVTLQPFESKILLDLGTNQPPVLQAIGNKSVNENVLLTFTITATDGDVGDTISYSIQNLPSGATFSLQTFSWTPNYDQAGSYQVRFIASDGNSNDSETITITVNNVNRAPVLGPIADQSINENALLSFSVSATDADGETITYSLSDLPAGAVFASQTFTWTPSYDQAGTHSVTFTADDGEAQDSETITITVINVNRAPVFTAIGNRTAYADVLLTFTIDATDPDGDPITYLAGTLPSGATFSDQNFNWTPSQSQVGSYAVTFVATDGQLQDSEMVTMTVDVDSLAPTVTNCSPAAGSIQVPLNNLITLNIADAGIGVDATSAKIKIRINDNPNNDTVYFGDTDHYTSSYGDCRRLGTEADYRFIYQPTDEMLYYDQTVTITVNATDLAGNVMDEYSYSFVTEMHSFGQNKQVNSGLDNNDRPVTVCESSGNIWAAWQAGPIDNRDIYISKLTAGEENFNSTIQLTNNANDQCNPAVALDSNDKLYVVWQDNRHGDWDIYVSTSVDGISWSTETRVNDPNEDNQVNPAVVIDGQNYAHIVWQDDHADNQDIYVATSSDGFATPTVSQQITFDNFDQVEPAITADSANTIYVVWTDMRNGSSDIYGAASDNPWTNVAIVSNTNNQSSPAIAAESTWSILHLLWVDDTPGDNDIYYASSNGLPGSPLTGSSIIDDSSGANQLEPTIAVTGSTDNNLKVFACWQDWRNVAGTSLDTDVYFVELISSSGTNVFVGDNNSNTYQGEPTIGIGEYDHPYIICSVSGSTNTDIYYAGSTFIEPIALASELVTASASSSTTVGTDPQAITTLDDVSIVVPVGACSYDVAITVTKIANLPAFAAPCLGGYDFGPSGIQFSQPVTITIPYVFSSSDSSVTPYWFNSLTGALSQQGITDIQDIPISSSLHALSFKTTHFTAFFLFAGGGAATVIVGGGGGGGGCSVSAGGEGNIVEYMLPYIALAVVMAILKMRDARDRKARNMTTGKC